MTEINRRNFLRKTSATTAAVAVGLFTEAAVRKAEAGQRYISPEEGRETYLILSKAVEKDYPGLPGMQAFMKELFKIEWNQPDQLRNNPDAWNKLASAIEADLIAASPAMLKTFNDNDQGSPSISHIRRFEDALISFVRQHRKLIDENYYGSAFSARLDFYDEPKGKATEAGLAIGRKFIEGELPARSSWINLARQVPEDYAGRLYEVLGDRGHCDMPDYGLRVHALARRYPKAISQHLAKNPKWTERLIREELRAPGSHIDDRSINIPCPIA